MNKTGKIIIIVISIVVLSLFEVIMIRGLAGQKQSVKVFIAKADIPQNSLITEKMLSEQSFPNDSLPAFSAQDKSEILGRFTDSAFKSGEVITTTHLALDNARLIKTKSNVLISLMPDTEDVLAWQVKKGEYINLLCFKNDQNKTLFEIKNVKIAEMVDVSFKPVKDGELDRKPKYIILETTAKQAKEIVVWKSTGKIVLIRGGRK